MDAPREDIKLETKAPKGEVRRGEESGGAQHDTCGTHLGQW